MNILMIGLHYHGYTEAIADELRRMGHDVRLHDIQPRNLLMKTLRVTSSAMWQKCLNAHHKSILQAERDQPTDMVLFIQTHQMHHDVLQAFRETFADARFGLYNWDSLDNHDYLDRTPYFDTVQTFDPKDAARHGFLYLPLFASRQFQDVPKRANKSLSVYFVGNIVNSNRYRALDAFRTYCEFQKIHFQLYMACTPVVRRWLKREKIKPQGLSSGSITPEAFQDMLQTSNAVFDFANHAQTGYTMRIFENLCAGKKIVTNNRRIKQEDFFSADRILVVRDQIYTPVSDFLSAPLVDPEETFARYHIQAFARHLADGTGHVNHCTEHAE